MAPTMQVTHESGYSHYHRYERVESEMTWPCLIFMIGVLIPVMLCMAPLRGACTLWEFVKDELTGLRRNRVERFEW